MKLITLALASSLALNAYARSFHNPGTFRVNTMITEANTITKVTTIPTEYKGQKMCAYIGRLVYEIPDNQLECPTIFLHHVAKVQATDDGLACSYDYSYSGEFYVHIDNFRKSCPDLLVSTGGYKFVDSLFYDFSDNIADYFGDDIISQKFIIDNDDLHKYKNLQHQLDVRRAYDRKFHRKKDINF